MKTKQTAQTIIKSDEKGALAQIIVRSLLSSMADKYDVDPNKLLIGMQNADMIVQVYDQGVYPVWKTLEVITFED